MPVRDWSKVDVGVFHDFHQSWVIGIRNSLNRGLLLDGLYAMVEQVADGETELHGHADAEIYAAKADRIVIRDANGDSTVSTIEVISPGNKTSEFAISKIVARLSRELENERHLLIIDLHKPHDHERLGLHAKLWEHLIGKPQNVGVSEQEPFGISSYRAGVVPKAYFHRIGLHATLPDVLLYLTAEPPVLTAKNYVSFLTPSSTLRFSAT